jgi:hypothetical protein
MAFVPVIIVIVFAIAFTPTSSRGRRYSHRRRRKGFVGSLMSKKSAGVMCGPGGIGARSGRKR